MDEKVIPIEQDDPVEIRKSNNGYLVYEPFTPYPSPVSNGYEKKIYTFETFQHLVEWLDKHFSQPGVEMLKK